MRDRPTENQLKKIRIAQVGLGPLGQNIVRFISERSSLQVVAAIDNDPRKLGKDLGTLCSRPAAGITISENINDVAAKHKIDIAILTTVSDMERITPQIEEIVSLGIPVVSTCEELSYPWLQSPELSERIDTAAKAQNVAVLGTGVNPGFLMDLLPVCLTSVSQNVRRIAVSRIQNAAFRRVPFQRKIGAGLTLKEFEEKRRAGTLRHVGLTESIHIIAQNMGWKLNKTEDILTPVVAEATIETAALTIPVGRASGVQQKGVGYVNGEAKISLLFRASVGGSDPVDRIEIEGTPMITSEVRGGINGDIATCAITINAIRQVLHARPGLRSMTDIPVLSFHS